MAAEPSTTSAARAAEVWERLARVTDPELDEPVTELAFVTGVEVASDGQVAIGFRLPTYWCAANFAFMMADDMRREVAALPWVSGVHLTLDKHMYADAVNRGMAGSLSFQDAFGEEADGDDLVEVRRTFKVKSFQRRQETLLRHLLAAGTAPERLLSLTIADLEGMPHGEEAGKLVARYLERRDVPGPVLPTAVAFVDERGASIAPDALPAHLRALRRVGINMEFNGALCRGLLAERYGEAPPPCESEPTLIDFIRRLPKDAATRA
jgi:metal-sulfur cluster biosynthetic enzyme